MCHAARRPIIAPVTAVLAFAAGTGVLCGVSAAQGPGPKKWSAQVQVTAAKAQKQTPPAKGAQAIVALVNDEPVTAYEIEQRAHFLALSANLTERVKENFKRLAQSEQTNQRLRTILEEVVQTNQGKSRDEIKAIFEERKKQFAKDLERQALTSARAGMLPQFKKEAQEELIEERLKLQEAKKIGVDVRDEDVKRIMKGLADRNKMTEEQFAQHIKGLGVDINTMKERFKAQYAWREVIRRRFAAQISINQRDIDRVISASAGDAGEDTVELQVQKITLAFQPKLDQAGMARRYVEAEGLRRKLSGCKNMAAVAKDAPDAKHEDLKFIKPAAVAEPTRSMLLSAKDGDVLPPTTASAGIEIYAVCGRRSISADEKQREKAQDELQQREFENFSKRHLRDLRQDAHIEYR
jgi:peptidyl-prolyl cis-trans isomerase SurA